MLLGHNIRLGLPALAFMAALLVIPLLRMIYMSVQGPDGFSLAAYATIMSPGYGRIILSTFLLAAGVTLTTLLVAYPLAYLLSTWGKKLALLAALVLLMPFLTGSLVRTYAWIAILAHNGPLNAVLSSLGMGRVEILYSWTAVVLGSVYVMLPYMVASLYSTMRGIDWKLISAAESLGAGKITIFTRIFFPLTKPGVLAGSALVFILMLGSYIQPLLLGGISSQVVSTAIDLNLRSISSWSIAAALGVILSVLAGVFLGLSSQVVSMNRLLRLEK